MRRANKVSFFLRKLSPICLIIALIQPAWASFERDFKTGAEQYQAGRYAEAVQSLARALKANPKNELAWYVLANSYFQSKKYGLARSAYRRLVKIGGLLSDEGKIGIARTHRLQNHLEPSFKVLNEVDPEKIVSASKPGFLREKKALLESTLNRANQFYENKEYSKAVDLLSPSADFFDDTRHYFLLGLSSRLEGNYFLAERAFTNVARLEGEKNLKSEALKQIIELESLLTLPLQPYLYGLFAGGYDSNIFRDGYSETRDGNAVAQSFLNGDLPLGRKSRFFGHYEGFFEEVIGRPDFRILSQEASIGWQSDTTWNSPPTSPGPDGGNLRINVDHSRPQSRASITKGKLSLVL